MFSTPLRAKLLVQNVDQKLCQDQSGIAVAERRSLLQNGEHNRCIVCIGFNNQYCIVKNIVAS